MHSTQQVSIMRMGLARGLFIRTHPLTVPLRIRHSKGSRGVVLTNTSGLCGLDELDTSRVKDGGI